MGRPPPQKDSLGSMLYHLHPTEDDRYNAYFKEDWWLLEEFACLMVGMIPEVYQALFLNYFVIQISMQKTVKNSVIISLRESSKEVPHE